MKKEYVGMLFVFLSALCFSINGLLVKFFTWDAMSINAVGNLIGTLTIIVYMVFAKHKFIVNRPVVIGSIFVFLSNLLTTYANKMTTAANAVVLQFTMPIFIIAAAWIFFKERPKKLDVIASFAVIIGIVFFVVDGLAIGNWMGNFIALLSGVTCAGVYMLEEIPGNDAFSAVVIGKALCFLIGAPAIPGAMSENPMTLVPVIMMLIYGVVQCGLGYVFLPIGLKYARPVPASLLSAAEPILAPVWVALFYPAESVSGVAMIGAGIVMVSLIIYNVIKAKGEEAVA